MRVDLALIADSVEEWIKAEYAYRLGPNPYTTRKQTRLIEAEEVLRKVLTGKKFLRNAAKALGVDVNHPEFQSRPLCKTYKSPKGHTQPKHRKGLFD